MNIIAPHKIMKNSAKYAEIKAYMEEAGAPTLKAVWMDCFGAWVALEGSHRLNAAAELGLVPEIEEIDYNEDIKVRDITDIDMDCSIAEFCDRACESAIIFDFED